MIFYLIIIVLLLLAIQRQWRMRRILVLSRKLQNPYKAWPALGHGLMFVGSGEDRMKSLQKLGYEAIKSNYGLTSLWLGPEYIALTGDPVIAEVVTKTFLGKSIMVGITRHLMGNGSLFAPVPIWRPRRKILAPTFSPKNIDRFINIFAEQSMITVNCLESRAGSGTFSIWNNVISYTMDSICQTALGIEINSQKQCFHPFSTAFNEYCKLIAARILQPWLHWDWLYKLLPVYQKAESYRKIIHDFIDDTIREKKMAIKNKQISATLNTGTQNNEKYSTFLELLIKSSGGSDGYTDLEIREEILVMALAGTDTSAVGTSFAILMLSRHPDVQEKAYEEVLNVFGDSKRPITIEDLSRLKYIDALIKETLRLYPPVPVFVRKIDEDVKLSPEITLPSGTSACVNIWAIHRNPRYWGTDAEEFNPGRFLNGSVIPRAAFIAFSYGPRNCLGYQYAMMSMKVLVSTLLRNYKVLPPSGISSEDLKKPLRVQFDIMMKDVDNFRVRLEHRT